MGLHVLYCLIKDKKPCYIGVTSKHRLRIRVNEHKSQGKSFDSFKIVKEYKFKKEALVAENSIIRLNGLFDIGLINSKLPLDDYYNMRLNETL
jgi:predicted GIY-YIG superfamily endonuclease